jgi:hypothetical protein
MRCRLKRKKMEITVLTAVRELELEQLVSEKSASLELGQLAVGGARLQQQPLQHPAAVFDAEGCSLLGP